MELREFTSPNPKPWLVINCANLKADTAEIDDITSNLLTLNNEISVPNAPINSTSFYSSGQGNLSQVDDLGNVTTYTTSAVFADALTQTGPSNVGNIPIYTSAISNVVQDSGITSSNVFLADGSVQMSADIDLNNNGLINANLINLSNQVSVLNPTVNHTSFYSSGLNNLSQVDDIGNVATYASNLNAVLNTNGVATDNQVAVFDGATGLLIRTSGKDFNNVALNPASSNLDMNIYSIDVSTLTNNLDVGQTWGNGANNGGFSGNSAIGHGVVCTQNDCHAFGRDMTLSANNCVSLGIACDNNGFNSLAIGSSSVIIDGQNNIAIGQSCSAGAVLTNNCVAIGNSAINSVANSVLIGDASCANWRPNSLICDLGTSASPFLNVNTNNLRLVQGANKTSGSGAVLVGGTVTVANTSINTGDIVLLSCSLLGGTSGIPSVINIVDSTSFDIVSSSVLDTSTYSWVIIKQV